MARGNQNTKMPMPTVKPNTKVTDEVQDPSSISPTPGVVHPSPGLDMPASLIPGFDPNPAGLSENPHVEDPKAVTTELEKEILNDLENKPEVPSKEEQDLKDLQTLGTPEHNKGYTVANEGMASNVKVPKAPKGGFEVIATRLGFYKQERLRENDVFHIEKFEDVGEWMKFTDPDLEKKRVKFFQDKKAR